LKKNTESKSPNNARSVEEENEEEIENGKTGRKRSPKAKGGRGRPKKGQKKEIVYEPPPPIEDTWIPGEGKIY